LPLDRKANIDAMASQIAALLVGMSRDERKAVIHQVTAMTQSEKNVRLGPKLAA